MPFCHRHPDTQIITDYLGVSTCARCAREAQAAASLLCRTCGAAVAAPGLCKSCRTRAARARIAEVVFDHPLVIIVGILLIGVWLTFPTLCRMGLTAWYLGCKDGPTGCDPEVLRIWTSWCG